MVPATYAAKLASAGFVALTFDHRTFGESGGRVRDFENPAMKVEDIRNAITFLKARPEVKPDAIGMLGVCSGAGYSAKAAASLPNSRRWSRSPASTTTRGVPHLARGELRCARGARPGGPHQVRDHRTGRLHEERVGECH
jgi:fermentation-respiration switch protein FrsA (DUF1100 family)